MTPEITRLAATLFAQHDNRPDRSETLASILEELGLKLVEVDPSDDQ